MKKQSQKQPLADAETIAKFHLGCNREVLKKGTRLLANQALSALREYWRAGGNKVVAETICDILVDSAARGVQRTVDDCIAAGAEAIEQGRPMPPKMAKYVADVLRTSSKHRPGKRGPKPDANRSRDQAIAVAIYAVATDCGLRPTRNVTSRGAPKSSSACSIVVQVLKKEHGVCLSEDSVEKIWKAYKDDSYSP